MTVNPTTRMQLQLLSLVLLTLALTLALPTLLPSLFQNKETQRVGAAQDVKGTPATPYYVANSDEILTLCRMAMDASSQRPTAEGEIFLEKTSGGFRQYVTITLSKGMLGEYNGIERVDFIQEDWWGLFWRDYIDQWVVSVGSTGEVRGHWHRFLVEKRSRVLKEEYYPVNPKQAQSMVRKMVSGFLNP
jgi:hypothetical protein